MSKSSKNKFSPVIICLILAAGIVAGTFLGFRPFYYNNIYIAPVPQNLSVAAAGTHEYIYGDFYVSPDGDDNAAGTADFPFATIARAKKAAKQLDRDYRNHIVIALMEGIYELDELKFTEKDSGKEKCRMIFSAYGNGEVVFSGTDVVFDGAQYITFSNITVSGGQIRIDSKNVDISGCTVKNSPDVGISAKGSNINITGCTVYKTGSSAVTINGGSTKKLTAGNIVFENNLVYDTGLTDKTSPAVVIQGVGNVCSNNEILHTPGSAVYYSGNDHRIDYNYIHNVVLELEGTAAVTSADGWINYGNLVRYNCISTIGNGKNSPVAVAPSSGTQARGNIFINIPGTGVDFRGGRDIELSNNLLINCKAPIVYESITPEGERFGENGTAWQELENSPRMSDKWKEVYPQISSLSDDFSDTSSPYFAANPTGSIIQDNIILSAKATLGTVDEKAAMLSNTVNNHLLTLTQTDMFTDAKNGNYTIDFDSEESKAYENFLNIPFDSIGRY
ncbi:MAG: right-handed parallel beta-helix repeat-containing protein [Clostridia bacterium]|nr:right-handed parallel beta-helix repeat-containing protein [Clostridia bacterium]